MAKKKRNATPAELASLACSPTYTAAKLLTRINKQPGDPDIVGLCLELRAQFDIINKGDLSRAESILTSQAHSLDALFNKLAGLALSHNSMAMSDPLLRLALKAQAQCARTLEVLANIKNPPVVYARQANVTTGPQQINNAYADSPLQSGGAENPQTKLLEATHGETLDIFATAAASGIDTPLETVGEVNRAEDPAGQGQGSRQRVQGRNAGTITPSGNDPEGTPGDANPDRMTGRNDPL